MSDQYEYNQYKYNMHVESPYNISSQSSSGLFLPVFASHDIETDHHDVKTAIVVIHGFSRNAADFFSTALEASYPRNDTMIIVPYFSDRQMDGCEWGRNSVNNNTRSLHWRTSNWMKGANSSPHPARFTSSFDVMDSMVAWMLNRSAFSSLEVVTLAGFSAGAQYLNRYAWASNTGQREINRDVSVTVSGALLASSALVPSVRFILSDASSYLYLSPQRPDTSCRPLSSDTDTHHTCDSFIVPELEVGNKTSISTMNRGTETETEGETEGGGDRVVEGVEEESLCVSYDSWKHGISELPASGYNYLSRFAASSGDGDGAEEVLKEKQTSALSRKDMRFIFGLQDSCNCNALNFINDPHICFPEESAMINTSSRCAPSLFDNSTDNGNGTDSDSGSDGYATGNSCCDTFPDSITNYVSPRCEDMLQGSHRLQRGLLYTAYLERVLWRHLNYSSTTALVPGMTHNRTAFFRSEVFQEWAYASVVDDGDEEEIPIGRSDSDDNGDEKMIFVTYIKNLLTVLVPLALALCVLYKYVCIPGIPKASNFSDDDAEWLSDLSVRGEEEGGDVLPDVMMVSAHNQSTHGQGHGSTSRSKRSRIQAKDTEREREESAGLIGGAVESSALVY